jgi:putative tryptophan/tyrosine transport system substrate-binding protein
MTVDIGRRKFLCAFGAVTAAALPFPLCAQQAGRIWRIGMLETISAVLKPDDLAAFRQGLQALRYVEGQNLSIEYRSADGIPERFPVLARELVAHNVDIIITRGTPAAFAAKEATSTIPIVMAAIGEPLLVVTSLAHPGGNITGLSAFVTDLMAKRVELLRDMIPGLSRVGALLNMSNGSQPSQWTDIKQAARTFGMQFQLFDVRKSVDLSSAFDAAGQQQVGALIVGIDALTQANKELIIQLAEKHRLPAIYPSREFVDAGGLMTYGVNYPDLYRRAATFVDKVLKGAKPGDIPVEQPTKFEMIVNLKTANALGLALPPAILLRADEVIE